MTKISKGRLALRLLAAFAWMAPAAAAIDSVKINKTGPYEKAPGYTYSHITIAGSVLRDDGTVGQYSVPAVVIFPRNRCGNDVGVVDWLNSAAFHFFHGTGEFSTFEFTTLATGTHLFDAGYTYLTIQWNKLVTDRFGPQAPRGDHNPLVYGSIERGGDAWEILLDAARFLKNPSKYPGKNRPERVDTVLSSGYSQGGALQLELLTTGLDPRRVYDGHLIQMIGFGCWKRDDSLPHFGFLGDCAALPTRGQHAPVIMLVSESDMVSASTLGLGKGAFFARNPQDPNWRTYEMAGIAHLPEPIVALGQPNQNSADARPLFRAAFDNLAQWARGKHGKRPPQSRYFQGYSDENDAFIATKDADGHFAGGVRLPHVESQVQGRVAGAPLGNYGPLNPVGLDPFNVFIFLGGTFERFNDQELLARYPTRHGYVKRVKRAADDLEERDYITRKDRKALVKAAEDEPLHASDFVESRSR
ncbi:MAG: alpha/beta hydrolase domain-containing protein [Steroidobacteraceae bacterium]